MSAVIEVIHKSFSLLFDLFQAILGYLSVGLQLAVFSFFIGIILSYFYGLISNQDKIHRVKGNIKGFIYEALLFKHDLLILLKVQLKIIFSALKYASYAIKPILILTIPSIFIIAQLEGRFGERGIRGGENIVVKASAANEEALYKLKLNAPEDFEVIGPVRVESENEAIWKLNAPKILNEGSISRLVINSDGDAEAISIPINTSGQPAKISSHADKYWVNGLFIPSNFELPSQINKISVSYFPSSFEVLGISMSWITLSIILMLIGGLVGASIFGVTF